MINYILKFWKMLYAIGFLMMLMSMILAVTISLVISIMYYIITGISMDSGLYDNMVQIITFLSMLSMLIYSILSITKS